MGYKTSDLSDACEAAQGCALALRSFGQRRSFSGAIRTVRCFEDIALMREAVSQSGHDQVLVIDGGGSMARALFGDVMADKASRNGWAGVVVHGAIRDSVEIDAMDIGVMALGTVPQRGTRTGAGEVDVPLEFGGVRFVPGQRLVADADGVLLLPPGVHEADIEVADALAATAAYAADPANPANPPAR